MAGKEKNCHCLGTETNVPAEKVKNGEREEAMGQEVAERAGGNPGLLSLHQRVSTSEHCASALSSPRQGSCSSPQDVCGFRKANNRTNICEEPGICLAQLHALGVLTPETRLSQLWMQEGQDQGAGRARSFSACPWLGVCLLCPRMLSLCHHLL